MTSTDLNTYVRDNTNWLALTSGMFGVAGSVSGNTPPAAGSAGFYMQTGSFSGTVSSGSLVMAFPTAFPNGTLTVVGHLVTAAPTSYPILTLSSVNNLGVTWSIYTNGTAYSGSTEIDYTAIGF